MKYLGPYTSRRKLLQRIVAMGFVSASNAIFAEQLLLTPEQTAGPFYPDRLPLDRDNDLLIINDSISQAVGEILHLEGVILDQRGHPIPRALVEIWQCDANGHYIHSSDFSESGSDQNFQGYGRFETGRNGRYRFRTIRPVPYGSLFFTRAPHIHFSISVGGSSQLVTQMYVAGEPLNESDSILNAITDVQAKASLIVSLEPDQTVLNQENAYAAWRGYFPIVIAA